MTPDPLDQEQQRAFRELDARRGRQCHHSCICYQDDAITTPLDKDDIE